MPRHTVADALRQLAERARQNSNPVSTAEAIAEGFEVIAAHVEAAPAPAPAPVAPAAKSARSKKA